MSDRPKTIFEIPIPSNDTHSRAAQQPEDNVKVKLLSRDLED